VDRHDPTRPAVAVVVLNLDGRKTALECLAHVIRVTYSSVRTILVDNGSTDGSVDAVRERFPDVRIIEAGANLGFAGGNNLALRDLDGVDYVALLNNDAFVEPGWLVPLVAALEADPGLGAACPKILFEPRFVELALESPSFTPGRGDPRSLGVRVSGVEVDGADRFADTHFADGFYGEERGPGEEQRFRWSRGAATLRIPAGTSARVRFAAERPKQVRLAAATVDVAAEPRWFDVVLDGPRVDVIQNAGSVLIAGGYAGDRGFMEVDRGQYDEPAEVFAWCGCAVLMRREYLEEVGLLDERLFLYYEDVDLSWRGRLRGWRYRYVPESVVRHLHATSSVEGSELFQFYVERNRLLVHVKNAPASYAWRAVADWALPTARFAVRDTVSPLLHGRRPQLGLVRRRLHALGGFLRLAPAMLADRRQVRAHRRLSDDELLRWVVRR
jgi:GT2 family glycosyltransferase